ncbi:uncharacterized protein LOC130745080 [Lotus japonicus]|uniref:uncharacterized protein LOC130745080 n=1 Tax=Lotus japonicus TaxID=34305 RepID=UPI0025831DD3|nr:uncharacterized protein LOC130745080 [Lotus japonicus]
MVTRSGANGERNHVQQNNVPPDVLQRIMDDLNELRQHNQQLQNQLTDINQTQGLREGDRRMAETVVDFQPFTEEIANTAVPDNLKTLKLDSYYGDSDPKDHLVYFNTKMVIVGASDALKCKMLPSTFKKSAMIWFTTLPSRSIVNFTELSTKFLSQFSTSRAQKVTPATLFNVRQGPNETLQSYMGRFNQLSVHLEDKMPEICIAAFELGLKPGGLNSNLSRKPVETMVHLRERVQGYIREEQSDRIKNNRPNAAVPGQKQQFETKKGAVADQYSKGWTERGNAGYNNRNRYDGRFENRSNLKNRAQPYGVRGVSPDKNVPAR